MKALAHSFAVQLQQGFEVYVLNNEEVEIAVVPELGAKIISLKNLRTGREWMWHPPGGSRLFANHPGDDFAKSPLVGADECLPTVAPCVWLGRELPDHGEVWGKPWQVDPEAWAGGILKTSVRLKISPFEFERTLELHENEIHLDYRLRNLNTQAEAFLWAFHPLLNLQAGDQLELPGSTRARLNGAAWLDAVPLMIPEDKCAKIFAQPVTEGLAGIRNRATGDRLEFAWNPAENDTLGLWLTHGGWHGHHHFAIEPTNGDADALTLAAGQNHCGLVPASDSVAWQICLRVGSD
jgi:galactose mutarotase-like enzyme